MRRVFLLAAWAVLVLTPFNSSADSALSLVGNTTVGATFQRAAADGTAISDQPGPMRYIAQEFKLLSNSTCSIFGSQSFDGVLFLYQTSFNPAAPLGNLIAGSDDGPVGDNPSGQNQGSSLIENVSLPGAGNGNTYVLVTTGYTGAEFGSFQNFVQCDDAEVVIQGSCGTTVFPDQNVCLLDRFLVSIGNVSNHPTGRATPVPAGSSDTALFWFYNDRNWEVMVKVLNGCAINGHYWVFVGALTNQRYAVSINDSVAFVARSYGNPLGTRAPAVADTTAFPCN
jgi:hypothetical protein